VPAYAVTGDLVFFGEAIKIETYRLANYIRNSVLYGAYADTKDGYVGTLKANTGYSLPKTITARMNDQPFEKFTYDQNTGLITVKSSDVHGTLTFSGNCDPSLNASTYKVVSAVGHGKVRVTAGSTASALEAVITPDAGYRYPENIIITAGNKRFTDYSYDPATGTLKISTGRVSGIVIAATCPSESVSGKKLTEQSAVRKSLLQ